MFTRDHRLIVQFSLDNKLYPKDKGKSSLMKAACKGHGVQKLVVPR